MADSDPQIIGAGFGQKAASVAISSGALPSPPTVKSDTLQTKSFARILDLISEGEIEGLVEGNKGIYLNDTPLATSTGNNFIGVTDKIKKKAPIVA